MNSGWACTFLTIGILIGMILIGLVIEMVGLWPELMRRIDEMENPGE